MVCRGWYVLVWGGGFPLDLVCYVYGLHFVFEVFDLFIVWRLRCGYWMRWWLLSL